MACQSIHGTARFALTIDAKNVVASHTMHIGRKRRDSTVAINAVNFEPSALVGVRIRHLDGAASWKFLD
jgi:hypothetical protein